MRERAEQGATVSDVVTPLDLPPTYRQLLASAEELMVATVVFAVYLPLRSILDALLHFLSRPVWLGQQDGCLSHLCLRHPGARGDVELVQAGPRELLPGNLELPSNSSQVDRLPEVRVDMTGDGVQQTAWHIFRELTVAASSRSRSYISFRLLSRVMAATLFPQSRQ